MKWSQLFALNFESSKIYHGYTWQCKHLECTFFSIMKADSLFFAIHLFCLPSSFLLTSLPPDLPPPSAIVALSLPSGCHCKVPCKTTLHCSVAVTEKMLSKSWVIGVFWAAALARASDDGVAAYNSSIRVMASWSSWSSFMMVIMFINGNRGYIGHHGNIREVVQKRGPFSRPLLLGGRRTP